MKHTDGLFHAVFNEIAAEYADIENDHLIIDIGSALIADVPDRFDVIVTLNLYGDIISDIAAQVAGSVGLGGSANVGDQCAMFEAIHGSAPTIAGQDIANPSGLINGAIMMLVHVDQPRVAGLIHNAWLCTLEEGIHTADIYNEAVSSRRVGTRAFADAVIERLGQTPQKLKAVTYADTPYQRIKIVPSRRKPKTKTLVGSDLFLDWWEDNGAAQALGDALARVPENGLKLKMITNRGVKVWPDGLPETFCTDHWRCRFVAKDGQAVTPQQVIDLQQAATDAGYDVIKTENLYLFDGERGYTLGQGE